LEGGVIEAPDVQRTPRKKERPNREKRGGNTVSNKKH